MKVSHRLRLVINKPLIRESSDEREGHSIANDSRYMEFFEILFSRQLSERDAVIKSPDGFTRSYFIDYITIKTRLVIQLAGNKSFELILLRSIVHPSTRFLSSRLGNG